MKEKRRRAHELEARKRCSSERGVACELYKHKTAVFSEGLSLRQRPPKAAPKRLTLLGILYAASDSLPC